MEKITGRVDWWEGEPRSMEFEDFWRARMAFENLMKVGGAYNIKLIKIVTTETEEDRAYMRSVPRKWDHRRIADDTRVIYCSKTKHLTEFGEYKGDDQPRSEYCPDCQQLLTVKALRLAHHTEIENEWFCMGFGTGHAKKPVCDLCKETVA